MPNVYWKIVQFIYLLNIQIRITFGFLRTYIVRFTTYYSDFLFIEILCVIPKYSIDTFH